MGAPSCIYIYIWLVVWNMNFIFPYLGNFIIPTDVRSYFSEGLNHQPIYIHIYIYIHINIYIIWIINDYNPFTMCGMQIQVLVPIWTSVPCLACRAVTGLDRVRNHFLNFSIEFPLDSILRMPPFNLVVLNGYIFISRLQTFNKFSPYMQDHPT